MSDRQPVVIRTTSLSEAKDMLLAIDVMGGFVEGDGWETYLEHLEESARPYAEAVRRYILENEIKRGGDWVQCHANPVFDDGKVAIFSFRAWGDLSAAAWNTCEDKVHEEGAYTYLDFYVDAWEGRKGR